MVVPSTGPHPPHPHTLVASRRIWYNGHFCTCLSFYPVWLSTRFNWSLIFRGQHSQGDGMVEKGQTRLTKPQPFQEPHRHRAWALKLYRPEGGSSAVTYGVTLGRLHSPHYSHLQSHYSSYSRLQGERQMGPGTQSCQCDPCQHSPSGWRVRCSDTLHSISKSYQ